MNHNTRIRGKVIRGPRHKQITDPNKTLMKIAGHRDRIFPKFFGDDLDGFDSFWDGLKADMPDFEERLGYLDTLCPDCNWEMEGNKGREYCPECKRHHGNYVSQ